MATERVSVRNLKKVHSVWERHSFSRTTSLWTWATYSTAVCRETAGDISAPRQGLKKRNKGREMTTFSASAHNRLIHHVEKRTSRSELPTRQRCNRESLAPDLQKRELRKRSEKTMQNQLLDQFPHPPRCFVPEQKRRRTRGKPRQRLQQTAAWHAGQGRWMPSPRQQSLAQPARVPAPENQFLQARLCITDTQKAEWSLSI